VLFIATEGLVLFASDIFESNRKSIGSNLGEDDDDEDFAERFLNNDSFPDDNLTPGPVSKALGYYVDLTPSYD